MHCPITYDCKTLAEASTSGEVLKKLAFKSLSSNVEEWHKWISSSFNKLYDDREDDIVLKYKKTPPKVSAQCAGSANVNSDKPVLWCMSATFKLKNMQLDGNDIKSPTDNHRYKTQLVLKASKEEWKLAWKKLCKSLQNAELHFCNAYYRMDEEIVIYHYGRHQMSIGEWIWRHVKCKYSKITHLIEV